LETANDAHNARQGIAMKTTLMLLALVVSPAYAHQMIDYTTTLDQESYEFVDGYGNKKSDVLIIKGKRFGWMESPDGANGEWFRIKTWYANSQSECDPEILNLQIAHQYASSALWEIGGQTQVECGVQKINVYADGNLNPIIMSPGPAEDNKVYKSDLWRAYNPYWKAPEGYPYNNADEPDLAYSYSKFINHFDEVTFEIEGYGSVTYYDVIKIFWRHGASNNNNIPCGEVTPYRYRVQGYQTMGRIRWFAKDIGIVKQTLQWRCWKGKALGTWSPDADPKRFTEYRKWW
jgi:hypothetical protein